MLAIPAVVGFGVAWFTHAQQQRDQQLAEQRTQDEREAADKRAQTEREIATDTRQETTLQEYLNRMSVLLLEENLRASKPGDEVRIVARAHTLTVLHSLDSRRKGSLRQFLSEAGLINGDNDNVILHLQKADLDKANLTGIFLHGVNLSRANINDANLHRAILTNALLELTDMKSTDLSSADLIRANLSHADMSGANLSNAILIGANLTGAILEGADLQGADLHSANLQAVGPACRLFPPFVQVRPVFILPCFAILFLYRLPGIAVMSLHRQTVHEEEASMKPIDLTEERVELHKWPRDMSRL